MVLTEGEVDGPVGGSGQGNGLSADAQREELWGVNPGHRSPSDRERGDEEIRTGDDGLAGGTVDQPGHGLGKVGDACGTGVADASEQTGVDGEPGHHQKGTDQKWLATAPTVDPDEGGDGHDHVDHVLDAGGDEEVVALETGHLEDISGHVSTTDNQWVRLSKTYVM